MWAYGPTIGGSTPLWGPLPSQAPMIHVKGLKVILHPWIKLVFSLKGVRSSHRDPWAHNQTNRRAKVEFSTQTHSTPSENPPHLRGWVHKVERGSVDPPRLVNLPISPPTSSMPPCRQAHVQMMWSIDLMVIWSKGWDGEHMDSWVHLHPFIKGGLPPFSIHAFKLQVRSIV